MKIKTLQVQFAHLSERISTAGLLTRVSGATETSFGKMELLEYGEEESNAPTDIDDDDVKYEYTDLFCEDDDEEDYDLCSSYVENPFAHLVQARGHIICINCVKKNNLE